VHKGREKQIRHELYLQCLRATGVEVVLGQLKRRKEKETDVAIASMLFRLCHQNAADSIALITGDTDLAPAVQTCRDLFPEKSILFIFPFRRVNDALRTLAPKSFKISVKAYLSHQLPDPLVLPDGTSLRKPPSW
jgi:uncharacterized LabA/DUF88 family protein